MKCARVYVYIYILSWSTLMLYMTFAAHVRLHHIRLSSFLVCVSSSSYVSSSSARTRDFTSVTRLLCSLNSFTLSSSSTLVPLPLQPLSTDERSIGLVTCTCASAKDVPDRVVGWRTSSFSERYTVRVGGQGPGCGGNEYWMTSLQRVWRHRRMH
jgi:hypothetical protein